MTTPTADAALVRIAAIEGEVALLKRKLAAKPTKRGRVTLEGIWKDIQISETDIDELRTESAKKLDDIV